MSEQRNAASRYRESATNDFDTRQRRTTGDRNGTKARQPGTETPAEPIASEHH